jgi:hypothetical protein
MASRNFGDGRPPPLISIVFSILSLSITKGYVNRFIKSLNVVETMS